MEKKIIESAPQQAFKYLRAYKPSFFESGIGKRLPTEYRKFYKEWREDTPKPVHYIPEAGNWRRDETTGEIKRIQNTPLPTVRTPEINQIFTGGEEIILGFRRKTPYTGAVSRFWVPTVQRNVVYSEILDKYLSVLMTKRLIALIHEHEGFENYLFQNKACDLKTLVAIKLKKLLFLKLYHEDLPYDKEKNQTIIEKYKKYLIPKEEIDWYGLTIHEACCKQRKIEEELKKESVVPLKHIYRTDLINELKMKKEEKAFKLL